MKLSVVVPNFNGVATIRFTLQSILSQLPGDAEVLVVDDCSTDNSVAEVAKSFLNVKIHQNLRNLGAASTRNIALQQTKGSWILFVDSDVTLTENCVAHLLKAGEKHDIVFPRILYPNRMIMYPVNEQQAKYLMVSPIFLLNRSALTKMVYPLFDETYRVYCEDTDFFLRSYLAGLSCRYQDRAEAVHNVVHKPSNRENRYFLELRNAIYGGIVFFGIKGLNNFDHAFKLTNILKVMICGLLNFNLFDMQARGISKPVSLTEQLRLLFNRHTSITDKRLKLLPLTLKAMIWNLTHLKLAFTARSRVIRQMTLCARRESEG